MSMPYGNQWLRKSRLGSLDAILTFNEINKTDEKDQSASQLALT